MGLQWRGRVIANRRISSAVLLSLCNTSESQPGSCSAAHWIIIEPRLPHHMLDLQGIHKQTFLPVKQKMESVEQRISLIMDIHFKPSDVAAELINI